MKVMIYLAIAMKFSAFLIPWLFSLVKLFPTIKGNNFVGFLFGFALAMALGLAYAWSGPERALVSSL